VKLNWRVVGGASVVAITLIASAGCSASSKKSQPPIPTAPTSTRLSTTAVTTPSSTSTVQPTPTTTARTAAALPGAPPCGIERPAPGPALRPALLFIGCATSADYLNALTWRTWTGASATGTATHNINDCEPSCAAGTYSHFPITVRLSNPGYLNGNFVFRTLATTPTTRVGQPETVIDRVAATWGWSPS
jgi:hypothetical protein